jgi:nicotinate-nucleotide adenylyltransferase
MDQPSTDNRRVAFFGGSFDPPHLGHLGVARAAQAALNLDSVLFAPVASQPLKPQGSTASFADRMAMTCLAIAEEPSFAISLADAPKSSGAPNFTLETLAALRSAMPPASALYCLMGADSFAGFRRWHRAAEIPFLAPLIIASRPGESLWQQHSLVSALPEGLTLESEGSGDFIPRITPIERYRAIAPEGRVTDISSFSDAPIELRRYILRNQAGDSAPFYLLPGLEIEISASEIRDRVRLRELSAADAPALEPALLPAPVLEYILDHGLYR